MHPKSGVITRLCNNKGSGFRTPEQMGENNRFLYDDEIRNPQTPDLLKTDGFYGDGGLLDYGNAKTKSNFIINHN